MKKIAVALSVCALIACQQEQNKTVSISGKINNALSETASIISNDRSSVYTDTLDTNANFEIEFEVEEATYMSFKHGNETTAMYVKPGDHIQLSIDPNEFDETINYTGSNPSNFLAKKYLLEENLGWRTLFSLPEADFLAQVADSEKEVLALLKLLVDEEFKADQEKSIWFQWASTKLSYKGYYEYLTESTIELSDTFFDFVGELDLNDTSLLDDEESYSFLQTYISTQVSSEDENLMLASLHFIAANFSNQATKDQLSYDMLKEFIKNESLENIDLILAEFNTIHSDTNMHQELADLAMEMSKFNAGQPAMDFTYPDINGNEVSLSDFEGSYVYVDVWATWCGPCKREIPHLVELEKDYHGKNIVFLSVSVDEDKDYDAWANMLEEKEMGGVQLFASGWSKITKDYKINGIPRFMLFDTEGNIVNVRASRPSNPATRDLFERLL
jgi:thiol-disulfide isomerase/thioredoxin